MSEIERAIEYIARGAAIKTLIAAIHNDGFQGESNIERHELREDEIEDALLFIPAADVEPVVREECDNCSSREQYTEQGEPYSMEWYLIQNGCKFCPNCGRKLHMDERSDT